MLVGGVPAIVVVAFPLTTDPRPETSIGSCTVPSSCGVAAALAAIRPFGREAPETEPLSGGYDDDEDDVGNPALSAEQRQ